MNVRSAIFLSLLATACAQGDATSESSDDAVIDSTAQVAEQPDSQAADSAQDAMLVAVPDINFRYSSETGCERARCTCGIGEWTAAVEMFVYASEGDSTEVVRRLQPGDKVTATGGFYHVLRPGVVVVDDTVRQEEKRRLDDPDYVFFPGDTLFVYRPTGEGLHVVWHDSALAEGVMAFWSGDPNVGLPDPGGRMIETPTRTWWVSVTVDSVAGWLHPTQAGQLEMGRSRWCIP